MPRVVRALLLSIAAVGVVTCADGPTSPQGPRRASLAFAPTFQPSAHAAVRSLADAGLPLDRVRIVIVRPANDTLKDTTVTMHEGDAPISLALTVSAIPNESLNADLQFKSGETVLFEGAASVVAVPLTASGGKPTDIAVVYVGPGSTAAHVAVTPAAGSYSTSNTIQFQAVASDANGAALPTTPFAWSVSDPAMGTISSSGLFAPSGTRGSVTVTATTPAGLSGSATATLIPPPASIVVVSGGGQTAPAGQTLAQALVVQVNATDGNPVPGAAVTFAATDGGTIAPATAVSDANGRASSTLTLGTRLGVYNFTAASSGFSVNATATATLGVAAKLLQVGPAAFTITSGVAPTNASTAKVVDAAGNPVPNVAVQIDIAAAAGTTTTSGTSDASGIVAIPPSFAANAKSGVYTITMSNASLAGSPITFTVTVVPGAATRLGVTTAPPTTTQSGVVLASQPAIQLLDVNGNSVSQSGVVVTAAITAGTASLSGPSTATTDASGLASFSGLSLAGPLGANTISFTATGLTAVSANTSIALPAGAKLAVKVSPSATPQNSVVFPVQPVIQIVDANDKAVAQPGIQITASNVDLSGTMQVTTDATGAAAFTDLMLAGAPGARTIAFAAANITSISATVNLVVGPPASLVVVGPAQTAAVGAAVASPQGVKVTDKTGNPVAGVAITFVVAANSGAASPLHVSTDVAGEAHVSVWTLGSSGPNTMTAAIDGNAVIAPVTITATGVAGAGVPVSIVAVTTANQPGVVGTPVATSPSVKVVDINGNGVAGVTVALIASGGGSVPVDRVVTDANGIATTAWTLGTIVGLNVLTATAMDTSSGGVGFTGITSGGGSLHVATFTGNPVTFNAVAAAGAATRLVKLYEQPFASPGTPIAAYVQVTDAFGNGVSGISLKYTVLSADTLVSGFLNFDSLATQDSVATMSDGTALVDWTISGSLGTNALSVTAVGPGSAQITPNPVVFVTQGVLTSPALARAAAARPPMRPLSSARPTGAPPTKPPPRW